MEEAFLMHNYFKGVQPRKQVAKTSSSGSVGSKSSSGGGMTEHLRSYGIQKIFDLHQKKDYKEETLFIAAGIFDRYINICGVH